MSVRETRKGQQWISTENGLVGGTGVPHPNLGRAWGGDAPHSPQGRGKPGDQLSIGVTGA